MARTAQRGVRRIHGERTRRVLSGLVAIALASFAGASEPEGLLLLEPNESIVHQGGQNLEILDLATNTRRKVPQTQGVSFAALSHDGCRLAFIKDQGIYVGPVHEMAFSSVAIPSLYARKFQWSVDGTRLMMNFGTFEVATRRFERYPDERERVMREALSETLKQTYSRNPGAYSAQFSYSPDQKRFVVFAFNSEPERAVLFNGSEIQHLPDRAPPWTWSADGESFINGREDGTFLIFNALDASSKKLVIPNYKYEPGAGVGNFQFSPDKNWLAFTRTHGEDLLRAVSGRYAFSYLIAADGSKMKYLGKGTVLGWARNASNGKCK